MQSEELSEKLVPARAGCLCLVPHHPSARVTHAQGQPHPCPPSCQQLRKYTLFNRQCWEWEPAPQLLLTQVYSLFACRKSQLQARDGDSDQSARIVPAHALEQNALPHYKF